MNIKEQIIEKIKKIDDPDLLADLDEWITALVETTHQEKFSTEEISAVREGYEQFKAGDTISHDQANHLFNQWLKDK